MADVLEAKNLKRIYSDVIAVDLSSLAIRKGALFGLLDPNGSGRPL